MGKVKQASQQIECHFCGQLWFVNELQDVCVADGPDDFQHVGMCDECAEAYEEYCAQHEDDHKYNEDDTRIVDAGVPLEDPRQIDWVKQQEETRERK